MPLTNIQLTQSHRLTQICKKLHLEVTPVENVIISLSFCGESNVDVRIVVSYITIPDKGILLAFLVIV